MAHEHHRGGSFATAWGPRLGVCWALIAALLIVMGLAAPGPTAARPTPECSVRGQIAALGVPTKVLVVVTVQQPRTDHGRGTVASAPTVAVPPANDHGPALSIGEPIYGFAVSSQPQEVLRRAYEATGPPTTDISQPA